VADQSLVCERIERVCAFSAERAVSQWNPATEEFLADPTGQTPLLLVKGEQGWRALSRKTDVPTRALQKLNPLGFAIQMMVGDTNGFLSLMSRW
jgi:hypothetical protein